MSCDDIYSVNYAADCKRMSIKSPSSCKIDVPTCNSYCFHFKTQMQIPAYQHVARLFLINTKKTKQKQQQPNSLLILRSAAPARRQRGAGRQRYSKPLENNKYYTFALHRIHTRTLSHTHTHTCRTKHLRRMVEEKTSTHCEETGDLPSRS